MKIIFLVPYPLERAPSQRFRVEQLIFLLDKRGYQYSVRPFLDPTTGAQLYAKRTWLLKVSGILKSYLKRWNDVYACKNYDRVFIHREAAPLGPPVFEWVIAKILRKKIIYDFDDAIWLENTSAENQVVSRLKCFWKVKFICRWADTVSAGNDFLARYAAAHTKGRVVVMPTVVNTSYYQPSRTKSHRLTVVGWTGTHSTLKYLEPLVPILKKLALVYAFEMRVIADKDPVLDLPNYKFVRWSRVTEIEDLQKFDIGLMPLTNDIWSEGKCGFKIIQYMALEIAAVAGSAGVNKIIIEDGVNGMLSGTPEEWYINLEKLLTDPHQRKRLGCNGRKKIEQAYSINAQGDRFLQLFSNE